MKKILIIEDDPIMCMVCQRVLTRQGFVVEIANNGVKGLEQLGIFRPDAVLLDMMMPYKNGIQVLQEIRGQPDYLKLPVIVLTNACVPVMIEQAAKAGATHILDKSKFNPVSLTELLIGVLDMPSVTRPNLMSQSEPIDRLPKLSAG
jgi:CheY-like chemotaxis protein